MPKQEREPQLVEEGGENYKERLKALIEQEKVEIGQAVIDKLNQKSAEEMLENIKIILED